MKKIVVIGAGVVFAVPIFIGGMIATAVLGLTGAAMADSGLIEVELNENNDIRAGHCAPDCPGADGPQDIDVNVMLNTALSELGTIRPTGFAAPGECVVSVRRWINAAGGHFATSGARQGYIDGPALEVTDGSLRPGDVVQYEYIAAPNEFVVLSPAQSVHTYMVLKVHEDGTHDIIESNVPYGSGLVGIRTNQTVAAPAGYRAVVWRFAKGDSSGEVIKEPIVEKPGI